MSQDRKLSYWRCKACERFLYHGEFRLNCTVCDNVDYCEQCATNMDPPHPHRMARELAYGQEERRECAKIDLATGIRAAMIMYHDRHCMGTRDIDPNNPDVFLDSYSWLTFKTIGQRSQNFGHGLRRLIQPHQYLAICAKNRPEWMITDFACIFQGIVSVPIYTLFSKDEICYILNNTNVSVVVCDREMLSKFVDLHSQCLSLKHIICMDEVSRKSSMNNLLIHSMNDIEQNGIQKKYDYVDLQPDDYLTIIYTSGSSGFPKGAIRSEQAFRASFPRWCLPSTQEMITFSYRPLAWATDRDGTIASVLSGGKVGFSTGDPTRLMEELALVRPTTFSAAPSIWNKIYNEFQTTLAVIKVQSSSEFVPYAEQQLLNQFSRLIPNRCRSITIGGAMVSPTVLNFMRQCFRQRAIFESYGASECGSIAHNGLPKDTLDYRLESVPEMGYTTDDQPYPRGELLAKTPQMFSGYINNPQETQTSFTQDGFFRTGDIVELYTDQHDQTHIRVIDRKKNFFKLAQGQFVSPEYLQNIYLQSSFVQQIYIHGDLLSHCVSAVVIPDRKYALAYAQQYHLIDFDTKNPHPQFVNALKEDLRHIGEQEQVRKHEIPSHVIIDFEPFTPENGLLTSSMKPCRYKIAKHYAHLLQSSSSFVDDIEQRLKTIIETVTGKSIDTNNSLTRLGTDSLSTIRLSRMIEHELGTSLSLDILLDPTMTLQQLTNLIQHPSQQQEASSSIETQLLNDAQLNFNIQINGHKSSTESPSLIFVSGTTGFVGSFLLAELLSTYSNECKCVCLVRCDNNSQDNPMDRVRQKMLFYKIWKDEYEQRIVAVRGDLSANKFGLDDQTYESLANQVDLIYHCGAKVNFIYPYSQLRAANVSGSREVIRFATSNPYSCIPIEYISTISVLSSNNRNDEVRLDDESVVGLKSGYAQSKWVAERLMTAANDCGVQVNIYRLGLIISDSRSGACNEHDLYSLLFGGMMKMKCYPESIRDLYLYGLPVDFAVKSIVNMRLSEENGRIYHVLNTTKKIIFEDVLKSMSMCGIEMNSVTNDEWKMKLKTFSEQNSTLQSIEIFFSNLRFKHENTTSADQYWSAVGTLDCPLMNSEYICKWLNFLSQISIN